MTAPFLSLAQIRNRLTLQARRAHRDPRPDPHPRCPLCGAVASQAGSCYFIVVVASGA
ncbi:hypothetical protein AB0K20_15540 [Micromonospora matsumotoense]|uniref:hypothetical protein n=1 Tax=Micromonospora matsumotoense TaxID=121616 RepID=UPI00342409C3